MVWAESALDGGHGVAKAGVDLRNASFRRQDSWASADPVAPATPAGGRVLDEGKTEVLERSTGILRLFDQKMEQEARREAVESIRKAARATGILRDAEERTRLQLTALARSAGFEEVTVEFH